MDSVLALWQQYLLGLSRVLTLVMVAPVLGANGVPTLIKVVTSVMLAAVCISFSPHVGQGLIATVPFAALLLKETAVGFLLSFMLLLLLAAFQAVGELMGFQMMFSSASTFLPALQSKSTVTADFIYIFSMLVFVTLNGHHWLIAALYQSFRVLPVLAMPDTLGSISYWSSFFGQWFAIGLRLALPVLATLLITNLVLGMIARTMPQLNIFVVGMPLQIIVGLVVMALMIRSLYAAETDLYREWARHLMSWVRMIAP